MTGRSGLRWRRIAWRVVAGIAIALAATLTAILVRLAWAPSARTMHFDVPAATVAVPSDAVAIERGRHLSVAVAACTLCHGDNLGGRLVFDHWLLGKGSTPNLTPGRGGIGATYRVTDWVRALRDGVARDGRGLLFMPVDHYRHLSDADLGALIAHLQRLSPVDNTRTALELSPVARLMIDLGISGDVVRAATIDHAVPPPTPSRDPGAYLVQIGGCTFCHGAALTGGRGLEPGAPRGPDLTTSGRLPGAGYAAFVAALRAGTTADGRPIDPRFMPWQAYRHMTDAELQAIWGYLQGLPPATGPH